MSKYEILDQETSQIIVRYNEDGSVTSIPMNEDNSDYQAYLESLKESK